MSAQNATELEAVLDADFSDFVVGGPASRRAEDLLQSALQELQNLHRRVEALEAQRGQDPPHDEGQL